VFVQVIQGRVRDADAVHDALNRWVRELAPGAEGWRGTTAGVTEDGRFIASVRFDDADLARRNSDRPEQDEWWHETAKLFDGEATFLDSDDVEVDVVGDPDTAEFVQVIQGKGSDPERAKELMAQDSDRWAAFRPDVLGSVAVDHGGGEYTMVMYFTNEAEARQGERKEPPPELKAQMEEMDKLTIGVPEFYDLTTPWLYSHR
jgi:hypothetical protein